MGLQGVEVVVGIVVGGADELWLVKLRVVVDGGRCQSWGLEVSQALIKLDALTLDHISRRPEMRA